MYLLIVIVVYIIFAIKFVDWKRWKEYYSTIQFFIINNFLYNFLFYKHTLWAYKAITVAWLNHTIIELAFSFFIIPVIIMIYLRYFPKGIKKFFYIAVWITYFSLIEYLFYKRGLFIYDNGWGPIWSIWFNIALFTLIRVHYKKPLLALLLSIPVIAILMVFFHPMLHELK